MWEVIHTLDAPTTNTELQEFFEACYVNVIADRSHFKVDRNVLGFITEKSQFLSSPPSTFYKRKLRARDFQIVIEFLNEDEIPGVLILPSILLYALYIQDKF